MILLMVVDLHKALPETDAEILLVVGHYLYGENWQRPVARKIGRPQKYVWEVIHRDRKLQPRDWKQLDALIDEWRTETMRRVRDVTKVQPLVQERSKQQD